MGFRFRRSVKVFPGVRINFSTRGISTTIGVRGAAVTMGPQGSFLNVGLPGTGLSYRQRITPPPNTVSAQAFVETYQPHIEPKVPEAPSSQTAPDNPRQLAGEIRSASSEEINSLSLKGLRDLLSEAYQESCRLRGELPACEVEVTRTQQRVSKWQNGILLKHLLKKKYTSLVEEYDSARKEFEDLGAEIEKCRVALEIEMEEGINTTYGTLVDAFRALAACEKCWDTMSSVGIDQARERSKATSAITREIVVLDLKPADVIAPSKPGLHFQNANGGDIFILPGLLLIFGSHTDFALIRLTEVRLDFSASRFLETENVPTDSHIVGETWDKVNKDGSPDRRFSNNYRIPIVEYGRLSFRSAAGLNEEYMFSNLAKAQLFAKAFSAHKDSLPLT